MNPEEEKTDYEKLRDGELKIVLFPILYGQPAPILKPDCQESEVKTIRKEP